ncbi:BTB/POZ domain-containing protein 2-like isoform X2 [Paramacrobiotus metropolitanus]|uniref:BTB/POZ domain-containing protein 2-like isoform X2 n=1 Tax=Paramacrobiotus metropolitanus TaxID=2943436 RepID=UPI00244625AC|nr:BTB/POZ domain-containing protein 2-like isoform X2 [Paramacrobiotus metropolitanus]
MIYHCKTMNPNAQAIESVWGWQGQQSTIANRARHIFGKDILSDVTFRIQQPNSPVVDIKAHKFLLAMGSAVFETMFYGTVKETKNIVKITDMDPETFRIVLRYIYYDQIGPFNKLTAFSALYAAKKYGIPILKNACDQYLRQNIAADNCLAWFVQARLYDETNLEKFCLEKIDVWGASVLHSADFLEIDREVLSVILRRDTLKVKEVDVYNAVMKWVKHQCEQQKIDFTGANQRSVLGDALFLIRFPTMTSEEVATGPAKSGALLAEEISQLFQFWFAKIALPEKFIHRMRHGNETEVAISRFDSTNSMENWTYMAGFPDVIRDQPRELESFRQIWNIPGHTNSTTAKFKFGSAFPVMPEKQYALSLEIKGMQQSVYGTTGKSTVTTSSGNCALSVQFFDTLDPEYDRQRNSSMHGYYSNQRQIGYNPKNGSSTCGTTSATNGQFPQLYFTVEEPAA